MEQEAGIPGWLKGCQHLLWPTSAGQESSLGTGDASLGNLSGAVIILLKSDLIGDTSVGAPAAPLSQLPYKNGRLMF